MNQSLAPETYHRTSDTTPRYPQIQGERHLLPFANPLPGSQNYIATDTGTIEHEGLEADNIKLAQALLEMNRELNAARKATCDLAAWSLDERSRLITEALHQRLFREDYESILRQRDEQVVYLLTLYQEAKLDHTRTLVREGKVMDGYISTVDLEQLNKMRAQVSLPPIDENGNVIHGFQPESCAREMQLDATAEETRWDHNARPDRITEEASALEEGELVEDEEGANSPASAVLSTSIVDQVDALIAEEKYRVADW